MGAYDLLVLGDINPDLVLRGDDVRPVLGQAERIVDEARFTIGGSGAITACGTAALGLRVGIRSSLEDSLALANACGAMSARAVGGTDGQPTMDQARAVMTEVTIS